MVSFFLPSPFVTPSKEACGLVNLRDDIQGMSNSEKLSSLIYKLSVYSLHSHGVVILFINALCLREVELVSLSTIPRPLNEALRIKVDISLGYLSAREFKRIGFLGSGGFHRFKASGNSKYPCAAWIPWDAVMVMHQSFPSFSKGLAMRLMLCARSAIRYLAKFAHI